VTISYVNVLTPCHLRGPDLLASGFAHECEQCEGLMETVDPRWALWHDDCGEKVGVEHEDERASLLAETGNGAAQRGMIALECERSGVHFQLKLIADDKSSIEARRCPVCLEIELTFERSWNRDAAAEAVMQWYSQAGIDWSIMPVSVSGAPLASNRWGAAR